MRTGSLIGPRARQYNNLAEVQRKIINNLPTNLPEVELKAFRTDIQQTTAVEAAMDQYLNRFGRETFDRIFPASPAQ